MLERVWRKGMLLHCWWEYKLVQPLWRTVWRVPKKLNIELPYEWAIPLLGIYLEKTTIWKAICTPMFTAALLTTAKTWRQPKYPLTENGIDEVLFIHITWNISHRKEWSNTICSNMDKPRHYHTKWSQRTTNIISFIYET